MAKNEKGLVVVVNFDKGAVSVMKKPLEPLAPGWEVLDDTCQSKEDAGRLMRVHGHLKPHGALAVEIMTPLEEQQRRR